MKVKLVVVEAFAHLKAKMTIMTAMTAASAETPKQIRMPRFDLSLSDEVIWSWEANISPSNDRSKGYKTTG